MHHLGDFAHQVKGVNVINALAPERRKNVPRNKNSREKRRKREERSKGENEIKAKVIIIKMKGYPASPTSVRSINACYKSQGDVTYHKRNRGKRKYPTTGAHAHPGKGYE